MNRKFNSGLAVASLFAFGAFFLLGGYAGGVSSGTDKKTDKTLADVRAVLDAQVAAWNRGDIAAFMEGYEKSDAIVFVSGDNVTRGWQTVTDRYKRNYDTRERMGTLSFSDLEFKPLSPHYTMVVGRFQLTRVADTPRGRFTLLFRRTNDGWRIVHDHTSSAS